MRALGVPELLTLWERAYGQRPALRALTLAAVAPSGGDHDPHNLSVGDRDARLLSLREAVFGNVVDGIAACAACGEKMEISFTTDDARVPGRPAAGALLVIAEYEIEWRLPSSGDLAALSPDEGVEGAGTQLLERCVVRALRSGQAIAPRDLPSPVREALAQAVERADPQADVELTLTCPHCAHVNLVPFDVATFFWDELNAWACRTLQDVHLLASAYGWTERDVLGISSFRRQVYLEMLGP